MNNTINGRTPEEIKKGLECCSPRYESKHWVSCSSECPFRNEGVYCRNVLHACNKKYIQLLEDGIDRVYKQVDALRGLPEKIQQLERERDAAVEAVEKLAYNADRSIACEFCEFRDYQCIDCEFKWRGVPQEVEE